MQDGEMVQIGPALEELERRLEARIGRWALAIMGTTVALSIAAASQWFGLIGRVERLEAWKSDRAKPIEDYYQFKEELAGRLARIEETQKTNSARLEAIQTAILNLRR